MQLKVFCLASIYSSCPCCTHSCFQAVKDMKKKLSASRALYISHIEAVQNVVRLHKASSIAALEEISSLASSNAQSIEDVGSNKLSFFSIYPFNYFMNI